MYHLKFVSGWFQNSCLEQSSPVNLFRHTIINYHLLNNAAKEVLINLERCLSINYARSNENDLKFVVQVPLFEFGVIFLLLLADFRLSNIQELVGLARSIGNLAAQPTGLWSVFEIWEGSYEVVMTV